MLPVSIGLPGSCSQGSYSPSSGAFQIKYLYFRGHPEYYSLTTLDTTATRDDKINDCGFKFSVACEWHILIEEEDKDAICQSFPHQILKVNNLLKFYPAIILHYMVVCMLTFVLCIITLSSILTMYMFILFRYFFHNQSDCGKLCVFQFLFFYEIYIFLNIFIYLVF